MKKSQVSVERLAQMFGVSYDTKKAFQPNHVFLVNECYNYGKNSSLLMQELQLEKTGYLSV